MVWQRPPIDDVKVLISCCGWLVHSACNTCISVAAIGVQVAAVCRVCVVHPIDALLGSDLVIWRAKKEL